MGLTGYNGVLFFLVNISNIFRSSITHIDALVVLYYPLSVVSHLLDLLATRLNAYYESPPTLVPTYFPSSIYQVPDYILLSRGLATSNPTQDVNLSKMACSFCMC